MQETVKSAIRRIKAVSLTSQWRTQEVSASSGNNTILIERVGATQPSSSPSSSNDEHSGILSELIAKAEEALLGRSDSASSTTDKSNSDSTSKSLTGADKLKKRMEEEESRLAVAAHLQLKSLASLTPMTRSRLLALPPPRLLRLPLLLRAHTEKALSIPLAVSGTLPTTP